MRELRLTRGRTDPFPRAGIDENYSAHAPYFPVSLCRLRTSEWDSEELQEGLVLRLVVGIGEGDKDRIRHKRARRRSSVGGVIAECLFERTLRAIG